MAEVMKGVYEVPSNAQMICVDGEWFGFADIHIEMEIGDNGWIISVEGKTYIPDKHNKLEKCFDRNALHNVVLSLKKHPIVRRPPFTREKIRARKLGKICMKDAQLMHVEDCENGCKSFVYYSGNISITELTSDNDNKEGER